MRLVSGNVSRMVAMAAVAACSGGTSAAPGPSPEAGSTTGATATVSSRVVDGSNLNSVGGFDGTKYPGLAGVEVCLSDDASVPCTMTDAGGNYDLPGVPAATTFTLSFKKTGYVSSLWNIAAGAAGVVGTTFLMSVTALDSQLIAAGAKPDATKGTVWFGAGTIGPSQGAVTEELFGTADYYYAPGYTVTVTPAATVGPVYISSSWVPAPALTESSVAGWGLFQAAPGTYTVAFTSPTLSCPPAKIVVVAGYLNPRAGVVCQ